MSEARSATDSGIVQRVREILGAAFEEWAADNIDTDELERRKQAAPQQAAAEYSQCNALDKVFGAYTAAVQVREGAREAYDKAADREAAAGAAVYRELAALEEA